MKEVQIKFRPAFCGKMLAGIKTMTCRTKQMGEPGDWFTVFGQEFELTHVMRMRLGYVGSDCFKQEGCDSVQEFMDVWTSIHPGKGFDKEQCVWAHCFRIRGHL